MSSPLIIVADADAIVAQAIISDSNHNLALNLGQKLENLKAHIIFPATAITEAITTLQRKFSDPHLAAATLEVFTESDIVIESVNQEIIQEAKKLFDPNASKKTPCLTA